MSDWNDPTYNPNNQDTLAGNLVSGTYWVCPRCGVFCPVWPCLQCGYTMPEPEIKIEICGSWTQSYGWMCPRCKQVWAPWVSKCNCIVKTEPGSTNVSIEFGDTAEVANQISQWAIR